MLKHLPLVFFLAACGTDDHQSDAPQADAKASASKEAVTADPPAQTSSSYLVAKSSDLPTCDEASKSWLAYVTSEKSFVTCDGAAWQTVEIKGKEGKDGKDGAAGKDGAVGVAGADGKVETDDLWIDPITGYEWVLLQGAGDLGFQRDQCSDGFELPTYTQIAHGIAHGLSAKFPVTTPDSTTWTSDLETKCAVVHDTYIDMAACHTYNAAYCLRTGDAP